MVSVFEGILFFKTNLKDVRNLLLHLLLMKNRFFMRRLLREAPIHPQLRLLKGSFIVGRGESRKCDITGNELQHWRVPVQ